MMVGVRAYNERVSDVRTDGIGRPVSWVWRNRRYQGGPVRDFWITTEEWWREEEVVVLDRSPQIQHWIIDAISSEASGRAELALDEASMIWRLVGILD